MLVFPLHAVLPVALFTRAWIEIICCKNGCRTCQSPSLRGRGLKSDEIVFVTGGFTVALFTRAWIEIMFAPCYFLYNISRPLYEGVDWNPFSLTENQTLPGRPLYEGVDWNFLPITCKFSVWCRPLYEGVDWNKFWKTKFPDLQVALFTRAWIEMRGKTTNLILWGSRPLYEGVDWNIYKVLLYN